MEIGTSILSENLHWRCFQSFGVWDENFLRCYVDINVDFNQKTFTGFEF